MPDLLGTLVAEESSGTRIKPARSSRTWRLGRVQRAPKTHRCTQVFSEIDRSDRKDAASVAATDVAGIHRLYSSLWSAPRQPSALLVDIIEDQEGKYPAPTHRVRLGKARSQAQPKEDPGEDEHLTLKQQMEAEFRALPPSEQAARAVSNVRMFVGKELRDGHIRNLLRALQAGELDALELHSSVTRAASELRLPEFAEALRATYGDA